MNFVNTRIVVNVAAKYGASVEGEVGSMGSRESSAPAGENGSIYTEPETAKKFAEETGVDAIACAFGTVHGLYIHEPKLDFDRLSQIHSSVNVPLVMHGGSGVSVEDYKKVIERGIRKVNYYTYMAKAGSAGVLNNDDNTYFHDMVVAARNAMKKDVKESIKIFAGL